MEKRTMNEELISGVEKIEKNLEISQINAEIRKLEDRRTELMDIETNNNIVSTEETLHQQLQLLAERSKTSSHENLFSITSAMLDIAVYLLNN